MANPLPMPVHIVLDHPALRLASPFATATVLKVLAHYWLGGCEQAIPTSTRTLINLTGLHKNAWMAHGADIRGTIHLVAADLRIEYLSHAAKKAKLKAFIDRAHQKQKESRSISNGSTLNDPQPPRSIRPVTVHAGTSRHVQDAKRLMHHEPGVTQTVTQRGRDTSHTRAHRAASIADGKMLDTPSTIRKVLRAGVLDAPTKPPRPSHAPAIETATGGLPDDGI